MAIRSLSIHRVQKDPDSQAGSSMVGCVIKLRRSTILQMTMRLNSPDLPVIPASTLDREKVLHGGRPRGKTSFRSVDLALQRCCRERS